MKWIGQYIQTLIARFRDDVYLEEIADPGSDTDKFLVADADGKVGFRTGTQVLSDIGGGDITAVTVRTVDDGQNNTTSSGAAQFDLAGGEGIDLSSDGAGNITVAAEEASSSNKGLATFNTANFVVTSGDVTIKSGGVDLTDEVTGTLPVVNGGTGATTLASNSLLTGDGTSAVQAEAGLTYTGEVMNIGDDDTGTAEIRRLRNTSDDGGSLYLRGGDGTGTDKDGANLQLYGGRGTSNGAGGAVVILTSEATGSSGTTLQSSNTIASFRSDGDTLLTGNLIFEGPTPDANETTFSVTDPTADRTITVPDDSGTLILINNETVHINMTGPNGSNVNDYIGYGGHYNFDIGAGVLTDGISKSNNWSSKWGHWRALEAATITSAKAIYSQSGNFNAKIRFWKMAPALDTTNNITLTLLFEMATAGNANANYVQEVTATPSASLAAGDVLLISTAKDSATAGQLFAELTFRLQY